MAEKANNDKTQTQVWNMENNQSYLDYLMGELPGGPVVRTSCSHCWVPGFDPWSGIKIPQAALHGQKKKKNRLPHEIAVL